MLIASMPTSAAPLATSQAAPAWVRKRGRSA
jgi:hypothetical protein